MTSIAGWTGRDVLDLGCGSGFHLPMFAVTASSLIPGCCGWRPVVPGRSATSLC
jgi:hypothetical protein